MNETDINAVSKKYTNINERIKNALSDFDAEKAKVAHNEILKTRNDEAQITDTFNKIAHVMIIAGIILAALWIGSMLELGISSGWKSGEKHWVSVLYPIALLFHETALIYIAPLLVIVLAGGGYALMKYSNKRFDKAIKNYEKGASKILRDNGLVPIMVCQKCKKQWPENAEGTCMKCGGDLEMTGALDLSKKTKKNDTNSIKSNECYCYNCGKKLSKIHKFCPSCGTKVEKP